MAKLEFQSLSVSLDSLVSMYAFTNGYITLGWVFAVFAIGTACSALYDCCNEAVEES